MNDIKKLLLDAVPPLTAPPDRLASVRGRAVRRRLRLAGTAVAAVAALGTTLTLLSPPEPADRAGDRPETQSSGPFIVHTVPPSPYSEPPRDFPMPAPGVCPPTVDFLRIPYLDLFPGGTVPPVASVTLCRYNQSTFDLSTGENSLRSGPVAGDVPTFQAAFTVLLTPRVSGPASPRASGATCEDGHGVRDNGPPYPVDVVFVHAPDGTAKATTLHRYECDEPTDPYHPLRSAIDAALGGP